MKVLAVPFLAILGLASCQSSTPEAIALPDSTQSSSRAVEAPKPKPAKIKPYPLKKCLVTDEPLDEWDEMQTLVYEGQEMKFCCKMCVKKFKDNPGKYLAMLP